MIRPIRSSVASSVIDSILQISDFSTFGSGMALSQRPQTAPFGTTGQLEGTPHNYIHGWINGDMGNYMSPLDPIFWLHHGNIDRLWTEWSTHHPGQMPNDPRWLNYDLNQFNDLTGNPVTRKVSEMLTTQALGYRYDTQAALPMTLTMSAGPVADHVAESLRTEVKVDKAATFTAPLTVALAMKPALRTRFMASPRVARLQPNAPALKQSLRLAIEGITPPANPRVAIRVFINQANASANTPIDGPTYLGSVTFFHPNHPAPAGHPAPPEHGTRTFYFDLDNAIGCPRQGRLPRTRNRSRSPRSGPARFARSGQRLGRAEPDQPLGRRVIGGSSVSSRTGREQPPDFSRVWVLRQRSIFG